MREYTGFCIGGPLDGYGHTNTQPEFLMPVREEVPAMLFGRNVEPRSIDIKLTKYRHFAPFQMQRICFWIHESFTPAPGLTLQEAIFSHLMKGYGEQPKEN